jgi:hypothetical protein
MHKSHRNDDRQPDLKEKRERVYDFPAALFIVKFPH